MGVYKDRPSPSNIPSWVCQVRIVVRNLIYLIYIVMLLTLPTSCGYLTNAFLSDNSAPVMKEIMTNALTHLDLGEVSKAKNYVDRLILRNPKHEIALDLRKQIEMEPNEYFKQLGWHKKCSYTVQRVDSLSRIAKTYFNDKNKFYALAKLNGISVPQNLRRSQIIQLPAADCLGISVNKNRDKKILIKPNQPKKTAKIKPVPESEIPKIKKLPLDHYFAQAAEKERLDQLKVALDIINLAGKKHGENNHLLGLRKSLSDQIDARRYLKLGDELQATKQPVKALEYYQRARLLYQGASTHSQAPSRITDELSVLSFYINKLALQISQQADEYTLQAEKYQKRDDVKSITSLKDLEGLELSLSYYQKAIALSPDRQTLQLAQQRVREQLVEHYHRLALKRYSVKTLATLEEAIAIWDKLLRLSPDYKQATTKQNKAIKLRDTIKTKTTVNTGN